MFLTISGEYFIKKYTKKKIIIPLVTQKILYFLLITDYLL